MENNMAKRAIKISLFAVAIALIFAVLSLWVLLNQITATANLAKNQKAMESRIEKLEQSAKN